MAVHLHCARKFAVNPIKKHFKFTHSSSPYSILSKSSSVEKFQPMFYENICLVGNGSHFGQPQSQRCYAVAKRKEIIESDPSQSLTTAQKVKKAGKDATYTGLALVGFGVTGLMFFAIGRELLSSQSPNGVYNDALKLCTERTEVTDLIGLPVKGYGEMTKRGRRRHVSHTEYERDGQQFMRMKFYIEGPMAKGTVNLEMKKDDNGKWDYRYLFADIDDIYRRTVVLIDNR